MTRPPQQLRPRYGRIAALTGSLAVTVLAVLGGAGVLPSGSTAPASAATSRGAITPASSSLRSEVPQSERSDRVTPSSGSTAATAVDETLPPRSGEGRRVVFSEGRQRVWLVDDGADGRAHLPGLGQRLRQPRPGHLRGLLALGGGRGASTTPAR